MRRLEGLGVVASVVVVCGSVGGPALAHRHHWVRPAVLAAPVVPPAPLVDATVYRVACNGCASAEVVELLYRDVLRVPFVIGEGVEADRRTVTVNIVGTDAQLSAAASAYLSGLGYVDRVEGGAVHDVSLPPPPPPPEPPKPPAKPKEYPFVYHPEWRDPSDIAGELAPLFPDGRFSAGSAGGSAAPIIQSSASQVPTSTYGGQGLDQQQPQPMQSEVGRATGSTSDTLVYMGPLADQARLRSILPEVDTQEPQVMVRAAVFEVDLNTDNGSAINLAVGVLSQRLQIGINAQPSLGVGAASAVAGVSTGGLSALSGNVLSFGTSNIDAVVSALSTDSRFHLVTSPSAIAKSGGSAQLEVGEQVPVLGGVSYAGVSGNSIQAVDYKSSGVILNVRPVVHRSVIDVDLSQEISSFIPTTTGVNNTPTLQDRKLQTSIALHDGSCIAMAGLTQTNTGRNRSGLPWPLRFLGSTDVTNSRTDVLMVVEVDRVNLDWSHATYSDGIPGEPPRPLPLPLEDHR